MAQELPIQSWKRIRPSVVSASKSGAVSPIFIRFSSVVVLRGSLPQVRSESQYRRGDVGTSTVRLGRRIYEDQRFHLTRFRRSALSRLSHSTPQRVAVRPRPRSSPALSPP